MSAIRRCHPCEHCNKSFSSSHQLSQHNRIHTNEKPYKCSYCDKKFKQLSHVQQHTRLHTGERPYKCSVPDCGRAFIQLSNLQQHMRSHNSADKIVRNAEKKYICSDCGKGFKSHSSLCTHQMKKHSSATQVEDAMNLCPVCHLILGNADEMSTHIKKEHNGCVETHHYLSRKEGLMISPLTCPVCSRSYLNESSYRKHLETHPEALSSSASSSSSSIPLWPCNVCSCVFTSEMGLLTHMEQMRTDSKHQFEAQIILSCAAAEKRHRDAIAMLTTASTTHSRTNNSPIVSTSVVSMNEMNRNGRMNSSNNSIVNHSFKF